MSVPKPRVSDAMTAADDSGLERSNRHTETGKNIHQISTALIKILIGLGIVITGLRDPRDRFGASVFEPSTVERGGKSSAGKT